jgi:hypothetical protein
MSLELSDVTSLLSATSIALRCRTTDKEDYEEFVTDCEGLVTVLREHPHLSNYERDMVCNIY